MAALRGVSLSEVLAANMKNIQEVYRINMEEDQFQEKSNVNGIEWFSGASKENDLDGRRGLHTNLEMGEKNRADLLNVASKEAFGQAAVPAWFGGEDNSSDDSEGADVEGICVLEAGGGEKRFSGNDHRHVAAQSL